MNKLDPDDLICIARAVNARSTNRLFRNFTLFAVYAEDIIQMQDRPTMRIPRIA